MNSIVFLGILVWCIFVCDISQALTTGSNATSSSITIITKSSPSDVTTDSMTSHRVKSMDSSFVSSILNTSSFAYTTSQETISSSATSSRYVTSNTIKMFSSSSAQVTESSRNHSSMSVTYTLQVDPGVTPVVAQSTSVLAAGNVTSIQVSSTFFIQSSSSAATLTPRITESPTFSLSSITTSVTNSTAFVDSSLPRSPTSTSSQTINSSLTYVTSSRVKTIIQSSSVASSTDSVTSTVLPTTQPPTTQPPTTLKRVKPFIKKTKKEVKIKEGENLTLECKATGYPTPRITWNKGVNAIDNAIFLNNNSTVIIQKTSRHDYGEYRCTATNEGGADSMVIDVHIQYLSDVFITFSDDRPKEGSTITITCSARSSPRAYLRWQFSGRKGNPFSTQAPEGGQKYSSNFTLVNIKRETDAGKYTCIGSSLGNEIEKKASKVLEIDLPKPPTYPPAEKLHRTDKTISIPVHDIEYLSNGKKVEYVQMIVFELENDTLPSRKPSSYGFTELGPVKDDRQGPYIAAVFKVKEKKFFVLGDGHRYSISGKVRRNVNEKKAYHNAPLRPGVYYTAFQRIVSAGADFNALEWIPPIKTKDSPTPVDKTDNKGLIIGIVIALIVVLILVVIASRLYKKYHQSQSIKNRDKYEMNGMGPLEKMARTFSILTRMNEHYHTPEPIPIEEFPHHVARMHKSGDMLFTTEYERIRDDGSIPATHCLNPVNQWKNRYTNIVAYDHNRVKLIPFDAEPTSDYINASYIDGYEDITYIAAQGPLDETCGDFWRMIWEQNTRVIVMLTNTRERGRVKCTQYWPTSGSCKFEAAHISLDNEMELTSHTVRSFRVTMAHSEETRVIKQFHFTSWPDHGVPKSAAFLLAFVRETAKGNPPDAGPMVVHCSAGVGRTGTFIVIDTMLRQIANERTVDIFHCVTQLRKQRNLMVQTEQQYIFIHDAMMDAVISGDTEIPVNRLREHFGEMLEQNKEGETKLNTEFQRLTGGVRPHLSRSAANHSANKRKNRYANNLPFDETRVSLPVEGAVAGSDYINASYIDGYRRRRAYIATQAPLPQTFVDFWRMIWEQESYTIVTLAQEVENTKLKMDRYWPTSHPITYGNLEVEFLEEEKNELFDIRVFKIKNIQDESSRTVHQYHYMNWTSEDIDDSGSYLLAMIDAIHQWQDTSGNHVITVHCSAGVGRTGVFCAVTSLIERIKAEALVDVFMTVKLLREQRPAMVQTKIQYEYCYKVLLQYLDTNKSVEERDLPLDFAQTIITVKPHQKEAVTNHVLSAENSDHTQHEETPEEAEEGSEMEENEDDLDHEQNTNAPDDSENEDDLDHEQNTDAPDDSETGLLRIASEESDPYASPTSGTFAV